MALVLGHEHQPAGCGDIWFAPGLASVGILAALFEKWEDDLRRVAQAEEPMNEVEARDGLLTTTGTQSRVVDSTLSL
jgi:hypothetical protein